jgi:hypothetical protein
MESLKEQFGIYLLFLVRNKEKNTTTNGLAAEQCGAWW